MLSTDLAATGEGSVSGCLGLRASLAVKLAMLAKSCAPRYPQKMSKRCPRCGMATQKAEGCNKMSCGGCGAYW